MVFLTKVKMTGVKLISLALTASPSPPLRQHHSLSPVRAGVLQSDGPALAGRLAVAARSGTGTPRCRQACGAWLAVGGRRHAFRGTAVMQSLVNTPARAQDQSERGEPLGPPARERRRRGMKRLLALSSSVGARWPRDNVWKSQEMLLK